MTTISFGNPNTSYPLWARISSINQQTYSSTNEKVEFETVTQSTPALGSLSSNTFTFYGNHRLLVTTYFYLGSKNIIGPGNAAVWGTKNGVVIDDSIMEMFWNDIDEMDSLSTSFVLDVSNGDTFDVFASTDSSAKFGLALSAQSKSVQFTQISKKI